MSDEAAVYRLEDCTNGKNGGYIRLLAGTQPVCDFFPYARNADEDFVRRHAQMVLDALNKLASS